MLLSVCDWCVAGFYAWWPHENRQEVGRVVADCDVCGESRFCTEIEEITGELTGEELGRNQGFR